MQGLEVQPHLKLSSTQIFPTVLIVNDHEETEIVAKMADHYTELAFNREYRSFNCTYKGTNFTVMSCGTGCSGAAIAFEEIIYLGAKFIIMATGAYSITNDLNTGDIVIAQGAVRNDGVTRFLLPQYFPAASDPNVYMKLVNSANKLNTDYKKGISVTTGSLYTSEMCKPDYTNYTKFGANMVELEAATLMIISSMKNVQCATIHTIQGNYDNVRSANPMADVMENKKQMYKVCFEAMCA